MSSAIQVESLSKVYRVERADARDAQQNWRETLVNLVKEPLHRLRHGAAHGMHSEAFWALRDVNFEVPQGEVLGIIGRNGAGKSTLLKILSRITSPTAGRVVLEGRIGSLLEVGTGFHPDLTGRENVFLNGAILGMSRREIAEKFDDIVDFSGINEFIDTPVKRYSSGMRVRLGFGVAAYLQPEILIIDEVLAVGDVEFQRRCLGKMSEVAQSGRTVLFVSHNLGAVQQLTERCLLIEHGAILADGATPDIVEQYLQLQTPAQAGLITEQMHKIMRGVRFRTVSLRDASGQWLTSAFNFSPLHLCVELEIIEELKDVALTFGIDSIDGTSIVRFSSAPGFMGSSTIQPGIYAVRIEFELPLFPGSFSVVVAPTAKRLNSPSFQTP